MIAYDATITYGQLAEVLEKMIITINPTDVGGAPRPAVDGLVQAANYQGQVYGIAGYPAALAEDIFTAATGKLPHRQIIEEV
jgi:hypothetical protein